MKLDERTWNTWRRQPRWMLWIVVIMTASCGTNGGSESGNAGTSGQPSSFNRGTLLVDSQPQPYRVDEDKSRFVVLMGLNETFLCDQLHAHVIEATVYDFQFDIDPDNENVSAVELTVPVAGLDPDAEELLPLFPETQEEGLFPITDASRRTIKGSIPNWVDGDNYPNMTFRVMSISASTNEATMDITFAGTTTTTTFTYDAQFVGSDFVITGTANLDGASHGIPPDGAFGASCADPLLRLDLDLTLSPAL